MANAASEGRRSERKDSDTAHRAEEVPSRKTQLGRCSAAVRAGATNGQWAGADWIACSDGKWRAVEPGTFPLANGVSGRVGRLRAYGNAINPWQAAQFIAAYCEARGLNFQDMAEAA
jgi:DNA (cytosine-5)-methyltransferase 1